MVQSESPGRTVYAPPPTVGGGVKGTECGGASTSPIDGGGSGPPTLGIVASGTIPRNRVLGRKPNSEPRMSGSCAANFDIGERADRAEPADHAQRADDGGAVRSFCEASYRPVIAVEGVVVGRNHRDRDSICREAEHKRGDPELDTASAASSACASWLYSSILSAVCSSWSATPLTETTG